MKLSFNAIQICKNKYGCGELYGIENNNFSTSRYESPEDTANVFEELTQSDLIDLQNETVQISFLGQHILNMMINPEIFFMIDNNWLSVNVRIYIKNAFYLCVVENKLITSETDSERFIIELLPGFDQVIGAFVYSLYNKDTENSEEIELYDSNYNPDLESDFRITGLSNNSELRICGNIKSNSICYQITETTNKDSAETTIAETDLSSLVNKLSGWMFNKLSEIIVLKEENHGTN